MPIPNNIVETDTFSQWFAKTNLLIDYTLKHNIIATANPAVTDDSNSDYSVGSMWINVNASPEKVFINTDDTIGDAVWLEIGIIPALSLGDLTDVDLTGLDDNFVLTYDLATETYFLEAIPLKLPTTVDFDSSLNQTVFTLSYNPSYVKVYSGGVLLRATEYTASNGSSITLNQAQDTGTWIHVETITA